MKSRKIEWAPLIFGIIWLLMAIFIFIGVSTNNLPASFKVPVIISWIYDIFGIVAGSIIQFIVSLILIITSFSKKEKDSVS